MRRTKIYSQTHPIVWLVSLAVLGALLFPLAASAIERRPEVFVQTRAVGEGGNVDEFLTDVVPDWPGWSRRWWTDKELWGNQGYIIGGPLARLLAGDLLEIGRADDLDALIEFAPAPEPPLEKVDLDLAAGKPTTHRVVKGECLWYIAGYDHIYGNPLQWPIIYKANTDRIKNPDLIYPGQVFVIPRD